MYSKSFRFSHSRAKNSRLLDGRGLKKRMYGEFLGVDSACSRTYLLVDGDVGLDVCDTFTCDPSFEDETRSRGTGRGANGSITRTSEMES